MGEERRNTGARKTVRNAVPEAIVELVRCKYKKGVKRMPLVVKKQDLRVLMHVKKQDLRVLMHQNGYYCYDSSDDEE